MKPDITTFGSNCRLVRELNEHDVAFLLIGGAAVAFYGCRKKMHLDEIDILIDPHPQNARRTIDALKAAGIGVPFSTTDLAGPAKRVPIHTHEYEIDIITPRSGVLFPDLFGRSSSALLNDINVKVVSERDLVAMKRLAVQESSDRAKHEQDLACLERRLGGSDRKS